MADFPTGSVFDGYRIESVAGRGGMGVVYRATEVALKRSVALKFVAPALVGDAAFRRRFTAESQIAASLDHPNVVPIFHAGEHDGALYLAMRYVEGKNLSTELKEQGRLEPGRAADIVAQVASALDAAHGNGLVHRDVKPGNVLLTPEDHVYLTDFGLTKRALAEPDETRTGHLVGTLNYVAPEQIRGEAAEPRTDIYALGCVLFHALTGQPPFPMDSDEGKLWAHVSEPPPSVCSMHPDLDAGFDVVIARAMAKEPADRFETAIELAEAALAAGPEVIEPAHGPLSRVSPREPAGHRRERILNALIHPFNIAVLAGMMIAGVLLDAALFALPFALAVYGAAVARTYLDADANRKLIEPKPGPTPIADLLSQAVAKEGRVREAIEQAKLPSDELSDEVDRYLTTIRLTASHAELLQEVLDETPPEAVAGRLQELRQDDDPDKAKLIHALEQQLAAQLKMDGQLGRFFDQMEQTLVQLDTMRTQLIMSLTSQQTEDGEGLAAEVRSLRDEMGDVADDMAAAHGARPGRHAALGARAR